jgi:hypothetical protein
MYKYVEYLQNEKKDKLKICLDKAHEINKGKDLISQFFDCYEDLIKDYTEMQIKIGSEFSNII